jgi:hypothetical protein
LRVIAIVGEYLVDYSFLLFFVFWCNLISTHAVS